MKARLAIYKGAKVDLAFPVAESITAIGRDADNAVQLTDPQVSKRHAVIHTKGNAWTIEDANSTNGITVNGARVKRADLKNGDKIRIGPFDLVFESNVTGEWVPSLVIDLSSKADQQTITQAPEYPPAKPSSDRQ
ncbi:MAG: FHA domain-containing protein [Verrucomicrobia bacterium]|nr:FHA domain-containing protein [Verrucomicrobiota bacterium]